MRIIIILVCGLFFFGVVQEQMGLPTEALAQVGSSISADGSAPNNNAMLDVQSPLTGDGKGILIPRLTQAQRTTASASVAGGLLDDSGNLRGGAAQGLIVYQTDGSQGLYFNTSQAAAPAWVYLGNSTTNYLPLTGGTMSGALNMGAQIVSNVAYIDFDGNSVSVGRGADGISSGAAVGYQANGSGSGAALGREANGSDSGAAVGYMANGYYLGAAVGRQANGSYGAAMGELADGANSGAALGRSANGYNGVAVGYSANGYDTGVAVGMMAQGTNYGMAMGYLANGSRTNVAIGAGADAQGGILRIAIGSSVINTQDYTAAIRGTLYLDGGTGVMTRATFGSGNWTAKTFEIDHPLDPENKILRHYCLESPQVWNVYAGNAQLVNGQAVVQLPDYYSALNLVGSEIYSLTPISPQVQANAVVKQKVLGNAFVIAGNIDMEVSWTIKVLRNDPGCLADLQRRPVEQFKKEFETGN
ncbi:MAG: hypothetical protein HYV36_02135 [Lentisphaerae bacterium]|nr:hypothetical protein [Lentisphaerota bacterium]